MDKACAVVIVEDDLVLGEILKNRVNDTAGFHCENVFENPLLFLGTEDIQVDMVLLDVVMPEMNGLEAIEPILSRYPEVSIIMNTIKDDTDTIFSALKLGALGYVDKQTFGVCFEDVLQTVAAGGAYMTPKIARKVFDSFHQTKKGKFENLTNREQDVTNAILEGLSYKLIAAKYGISLDTVRMNIKNIYRKLRINSKAELFHLARK